ncbi:hypothetical protein [Carboxylicivirga marina]|uniref:ABC transmembrane type-1 domain-containing protein n=1 Tax=Carboxylicivirga marina TaxID=2800988 RepID=A0ABS1HG93_9BACT|nr:hypothetical protein [Carboxylicivirga marina]MBK3516659.1 hypothetical protein [Carboxylicivirga marina]
MIKHKVFETTIQGKNHNELLAKFKSHALLQSAILTRNTYKLQLKISSSPILIVNTDIQLIERKMMTEISVFADMTKPLLIAIIVGLLAATVSYLVNFSYATSVYTLVLSPFVFFMLRNQVKKEVQKTIVRIINS